MFVHIVREEMNAFMYLLVVRSIQCYSTKWSVDYVL